MVSRALAIGAAVGLCACTALLGNFDVTDKQKNVPEGGAPDAAEDVAAEADIDANDGGLVPALRGITQIVAGARHTCALDGKGDVYCWGSNDQGQLGVAASVTRSPKPIKVPLGTAAKEIEGGAFHNCAISAQTSEAICWGKNDCGQSASGGTTTTPKAPSTIRVENNAMLSWVHLAAGDVHTCGVESGGQAYCWGCNGAKQGGTMDSANPGQPVLVATNAGATDKGGLSIIAASGGFTCASGAAASTTSCWGTEANGELGDGTPLISTSDLARPVGLTTVVKDLALGAEHACALDADGKVRCWGHNDFGQLGQPSIASSDAPAAEIMNGPYSMVTAGGSFTCLLARTGIVACLGSNTQAQLGRASAPDNAPHSDPQPVSKPNGTAGLEAIAVAAGREHACAIVAPGGAVLCWGRGDDGQTGDGMVGGGPRTKPVLVDPP